MTLTLVVAALVTYTAGVTALVWAFAAAQARDWKARYQRIRWQLARLRTEVDRCHHHHTSAPPTEVDRVPGLLAEADRALDRQAADDVLRRAWTPAANRAYRRLRRRAS